LELERRGRPLRGCGINCVAADGRCAAAASTASPSVRQPGKSRIRAAACARLGPRDPAVSERSARFTWVVAACLKSGAAVAAAAARGTAPARRAWPRSLSAGPRARALDPRRVEQLSVGKPW